MPQMDVGYLIKSINDKLQVKADAELKEYGLTFAQCRVMAFLESRDGEATQKEIELFLSVAHPTVVGIVSRMEQNGYVTSRMDRRDKRNKLVRLTSKAEEIGLDMEQNVLRNEERLLAPLSDEERVQLKQMLRVIYDHLEG